MSSASRLGPIVTSGAFAAALVVTMACGQPPPSGGTAKTAPPTTTVGQVPGPQPPAQQTSVNPPSSPNPFSQNRTAMVEGRQLFVRFNCSGCHGGRAGGGMGPSLRDVDWIYGNDDARIYGSIAEGRAHGMPAWQSRMTPDQIWKLVTYIKSLRTSNEPNAPTP
jgi:cytochrome c oxidase cbb3-type subunit III